MIEPLLAAVRPRVISPETGESVLLEDLFEQYLNDRLRGVVLLRGPGGCGRSTALRHLAARFADRQTSEFRWALIETPQLERLPELTIATSSMAVDEQPTIVLTLAPWSRDEAMEYLLAISPEECGSVLSRLPDWEWLGGSPKLCRQVLDLLIADESLLSARDALRKIVDRDIPHDALSQEVRQQILKAVEHGKQRLIYQYPQLEPEIDSLLEHAAVRELLAGREMAELFRSLKLADLEISQITSVVGQEATRSLQNDEDFRRRIGQTLKRNGLWENHPAVTTILLQLDPEWRPARLPKRVNLKGARLDGAHWSGVDLDSADCQHVHFRNADLSEADLFETQLFAADLTGADLRKAFLWGVRARMCQLNRAKLDEAEMSWGDLSHAKLIEATLSKAKADHVSLKGAKLDRADLSGANLRWAQLSRASLIAADLRGADLREAELSKAVLRDCQLEGANLDEAWLHDADLSELQWHQARLEGAHLQRADLTATDFPSANFRGANLSQTLLGEISWKFADLREADLSNATFHMGSSRCGMLFGYGAGHGSKTGFYTDDFEERRYVNPAEICKASLRGADLRGANIDHTDFYLVDLRDAKLDDRQREYLRRSGALLSEV